MSTSTHPITILSDLDVEDAFSSTHSPNYIPASPDYFTASLGNTSSDPSDDLSKYLLASLAISPFHDDPYIKVMQAYNATSNESLFPPPQVPIAPPTVLPSSPVLPPLLDSQDFFFPKRFYHLINDPVSYHPPLLIFLPHLRMAPKRTSTSATPTMNQAAIRKLVYDSVVAALEAQAATMANTGNTNRNTRQSETLIAKKCISALISPSISYVFVEITNPSIGADNCPLMLEKDMYDSEVEGVTRLKKYSELSAAEAIQADCDVKATNIILQGLPPEVYALVSTHKVAKELWERIQMLLQGTSLTKQERECKL
nr:hypothetical protein [Tanacetum cinerariifolium]